MPGPRPPAGRTPPATRPGPRKTASSAPTVRPEWSILAFDTPVTGTFEFSVDSWAKGNAGYAGLHPESVSVQAVPFNQGTTWLPGVTGINANGFNRFTVQVTPDRVAFLVNGELLYEDAKPSRVSPWLTLFTDWSHTYRNPTLTGNPVVPAEVKLIDGPSLEGWFADFSAGSRRDRLARQYAEANGGKVRNQEGQSADIGGRAGGVRLGRCRGRVAQPQARRGNRVDAAQARLLPAAEAGRIGRLRLLLRAGQDAHAPGPSARRRSCSTRPASSCTTSPAAGENAWAGLGPDNAATAPNAVPVPLKVNEWNAAKLTAGGRDGELVKVEVNGTVVYDGPAYASGDRRFGVFHFSDKTAARVRNVVLRGNWPKTIAAADLAFTLAREATPREARARRELLGEKFFGGGVTEVLAATRPEIPAAERYTKLLAWVVPVDEAGEFRMQAVRVPLDVLEPKVKLDVPPDGRRLLLGFAPDAPCLRLLGAAKEAGKLDDLAAKVEAAPPADEAAKLAKASFRGHDCRREGGRGRRLRAAEGTGGRGEGDRARRPDWSAAGRTTPP